jgi:hypothetical protein
MSSAKYVPRIIEGKKKKEKENYENVLWEVGVWMRKKYRIRRESEE